MGIFIRSIIYLSFWKIKKEKRKTNELFGFVLWSPTQKYAIRVINMQNCFYKSKSTRETSSLLIVNFVYFMRRERLTVKYILWTAAQEIWICWIPPFAFDSVKDFTSKSTGALAGENSAQHCGVLLIIPKQFADAKGDVPIWKAALAGRGFWKITKRRALSSGTL